MMRLHFRAVDTFAAQEALRFFIGRYGNVCWDEADVVVALGGDGFMLETLHRTLRDPVRPNLPVFGLNFGSIGFLLNTFNDREIVERVQGACEVTLQPLRMRSMDVGGVVVEGLAFNEVSLWRRSRQSAKICITVDGVVRIGELTADGILVATPSGSSAYNFSVFGPILPLNCRMLALTPISAFRPRRWRGALLPHTACIRFDVLEGDKRSVSAVADFTEIRDVMWTEVQEEGSICRTLLFDPGNTLEERLLKEQFHV